MSSSPTRTEWQFVTAIKLIRRINYVIFVCNVVSLLFMKYKAKAHYTMSVIYCTPKRLFSQSWSCENTTFLQRAAMLALQALYYSYGNSVCLSVSLSVTRRYCVKTARSTVQFVLSDSKMCLVLWKPKKYSPATTPSPSNLGSKWCTPSW